MVLDAIDYKKVFKFFEEISNIPRGSGHNELIHEYLVNFAKDRNLEYITDDLLNIIIRKKKNSSVKSDKIVMLQSHMDMVCQKTDDSNHDFKKDPLDLYIEDGFIHARNTTLGADDGIGLAMSLAILDDNTLSNPNLEVLVTTDEETGMYGAIGLKDNLITADYMINIDSDAEGSIIASCAGGYRSRIILNIDKKIASGYKTSISVFDLQGGHSGMEIDKNRSNANKVVARVLLELDEEFELVSINGGSAGNAIPKSSEAIIVSKENLDNKIADILRDIQQELLSTEPNMKFSVKVLEENCSEDVYANKDKAINLLNALPDGVQTFSGSIKGLVETSLNLGILTQKDDKLELLSFIRSSSNNYAKYLNKKLESLARVFGAEYSADGHYGAWEYKNESRLREIMVEEYKKQYGKAPEVIALHAGLECGILTAKKPSLDAVSIGATMLDIHTVNERLDIESTKRVYDYVCNVLEAIGRD